MKSTLRTLSMLVLLGAGVALAQAPSAQAPSKDAMAHAKSMAMKDRADMLDKTKAIDAQVSKAMTTAKTMQGDSAKELNAQLADLQKQVKALSAHLAAAPKYFDNPEASSLKP